MKKKMQCPKATAGKCQIVTCEHYEQHAHIRRTLGVVGCEMDVPDCTRCQPVIVKRAAKFPHNVLDKLPEAQLRELVKSIVDVLYLELRAKKQVYNQDKPWEVETVEYVAEELEKRGLRP